MVFKFVKLRPEVIAFFICFDILLSPLLISVTPWFFEQRRFTPWFEERNGFWPPKGPKGALALRAKAKTAHILKVHLLPIPCFPCSGWQSQIMVLCTIGRRPMQGKSCPYFILTYSGLTGFEPATSALTGQCSNHWTTIPFFLYWLKISVLSMQLIHLKNQNALLATLAEQHKYTPLFLTFLLLLARGAESVWNKRNCALKTSISFFTVILTLSTKL